MSLGTPVCSLRLTFWHPVDVYIKAQHEAAQPIGHAWPHHGHCKHDPCNTKPGLGRLALASLRLQSSACPVSDRQERSGPGNSRASPDLSWPRGAEVRNSCPAPTSSSHPPTSEPGPPSEPSSHQGREASCCRGQSHRCRRCRRAEWAPRPRRAGSVP